MINAVPLLNLLIVPKKKFQKLFNGIKVIWKRSVAGIGRDVKNVKIVCYIVDYITNRSTKITPNYQLSTQKASKIVIYITSFVNNKLLITFAEPIDCIKFFSYMDNFYSDE